MWLPYVANFRAPRQAALDQVGVGDGGNLVLADEVRLQVGDAAAGAAVDAGQIAPDGIDAHTGDANSPVERVGHQQALRQIGGGHAGHRGDLGHAPIHISNALLFEPAQQPLPMSALRAEHLVEQRVNAVHARLGRGGQQMQQCFHLDGERAVVIGLAHDADHAFWRQWPAVPTRDRAGFRHGVQAQAVGGPRPVEEVPARLSGRDWRERMHVAERPAGQAEDGLDAVLLEVEVLPPAIAAREQDEPHGPHPGARTARQQPRQVLDLTLAALGVVHDEEHAQLLAQRKELLQRLLALPHLLDVVGPFRRLNEACEPVLRAQPSCCLDHQPRLAEATWAIEKAASRGTGPIAAPGQHLPSEAGRVDEVHRLVPGLQQLGRREVRGLAIERLPLRIEQVDAERLQVVLVLRLGGLVRLTGPHRADGAQQAVRLGKVELVDVQRIEGNGHRRGGEVGQAGVDELACGERLAGFGLHVEGFRCLLVPDHDHHGRASEGFVDLRSIGGPAL